MPAGIEPNRGPAAARCPTCGRKLEPPSPPRHRKCWACGRTFVQTGYGRARILCGDPRCALKRKRYARSGGAALDRTEG